MNSWISSTTAFLSNFARAVAPDEPSYAALRDAQSYIVELKIAEIDGKPLYIQPV
ncbi:MAG TPA: hypothetical protein IAB25_04010 [Candidatus Coproplasma stercoravium]|nr:hypothetical protein [Candidatus Coproplasma stercoravium]